MEKSYNAKDIIVLEGLEAVRLRPGMYIGTTGSKGMHHILWEIVDNGIDEIANGFGDTINIEIHKDESVSITDNGRGIPVDLHPKEKVPGVELVFTKLHAGGKFNSSNYAFSGGLHGVGAAVTNALSSWLTVEIFKNGVKYTEKFHSIEVDGKMKCGIVWQGLCDQPCDKKLKGSRVTFLPDSKVFGDVKFDFDEICRRAKELAFLNGGLKISVSDERQLTDGGNARTRNYHFADGIKDFVLYLNESKEKKYQEPIYAEKSQDNFFVGVCFQHTDCFTESIFSYVNNIPTTEGGTHETGFKSAFTKALNDFGRQKNIIKDKQVNFFGEDFREGLTAVLTVKMQNIQFEGQTKTKLGNPEVKQLVENLLCDALRDVFNKTKKEVIDAIFDKAALAVKARESASKAKEVARHLNSNTGSTLVGKLAACSGKKAEFNEMFIVEGDSAGGSAKQGRDRFFQAILPLKGKPLNAEKKRVIEIVKNEEILSIINALGTGFDKDFDISGLKYNKIIILADADQDGAHIRSILLTFFFRYMRELITDGHVYIGMPPLYRVEEKGNIQYVYDDAELKTILEKVGKNYILQRYKGLGEMNPEQLWDTTMNPATRSLLRVTIEDAAEAERLVSVLMGTDVESRKQYIYDYADFNKVDKFKEINA
ncbi:MAG: DNA gyrase subunit B [Clostridia bacterium]